MNFVRDLVWSGNGVTLAASILGLRVLALVIRCVTTALIVRRIAADATPDSLRALSGVLRATYGPRK